MSLERFRPLLAASLASDTDLQRLSYPMIASPKIDGIRVICHPTIGPCTRSLKPVANDLIRTTLATAPLAGLDGEVTVGANCGPEVFERTTGAVRSSGGLPDFTYWVFDRIVPSDIAYINRWNFLEQTTMLETLVRVTVLEHAIMHAPSDVLVYEQQCLARGYEGIMLRNPLNGYKFGRSTLKEQTLIKVKRFKDAEATIIGFEPLERNQNVQTRNELGLSERSSHKAGRVADDLLGTLKVTNPTFGEFGIGSGFDVSLRTEIWQHQDRYVGKTVTFKYQQVGTQEKPRFPIFLRFRDLE